MSLEPFIYLLDSRVSYITLDRASWIIHAVINIAQ